MKKINFEGKTYEVPDWVKWVAREHDYALYGFEFEPVSNGMWFDSIGEKICICDDNYWESSAVRVG